MDASQRTVCDSDTPASGTQGREDIETVGNRTVSYLEASTRTKAATQESGTDEAWAPVCSDSPRPLIPEGRHEAMCVKVRKQTLPLWKREVAVLEFRILDGPHANTALERFHRVTGSVGRHSSFYREWTIAASRLPKRGEHMRASKFCGKLFLVEVRTVKRDRDQRESPQALWYSKVARVLELLVSNEVIQ
jgi:hypothetical protein